MKAKRESKPTDIHLWKWSYRGMLPDGNKITFSGTIEAPNDHMGKTALHVVEADMRKKHPEIRWMQGREIEGGNIRLGPTVQRGKFLREAKP